MGITEVYRAPEIRDVGIRDDFWSHYIELVKDTMLPYQWEILNDRMPGVELSHAIQNFRIAAGLEEGEFYGEVFQDSDLAKWLEAAAYSLEGEAEPELENVIDEIIDVIAQAQQEDGYLDTYFSIGRKEQEWTNLYECHEMYCAGHMIEAAAAYYKATGKRKLLDVMCRCADNIAEKFGPAPSMPKGYPGHQEIELALVKLYEVTGNEKYISLSRYFLEERGKEPNYFVQEWEGTRNKSTFKTGLPSDPPDLSYNQSHMPVFSQKHAVGHAVRAMYMYAAMADVARITEDKEMFLSCRHLWENVVNRQMYITGAAGSTHTGEAFTFDYDLPNETAYAETCASVGLIFFAHRMQKTDMDGNYGDVIERILYNVILGSMSRDGKHFFYVNPLEVWPEANEKNPDRRHVKPVRQTWFGCACCPPNIARLLTSLGQYIYSYGRDTLFVHLYIAGEAGVKTDSGEYKIRQEGNYPWEEEIKITVHSVPDCACQIALRIPGWCESFEIQSDGKTVAYRMEKGYAYLEKAVAKGGEIRLFLSMPAKLIQANPKVRADAGKAAIQKGPVVYCLEQEDNGENLSAIRLDAKSRLKTVRGIGLPGGIPVVMAKGYRTLEENWEGELYRPYVLREKETDIIAVPYFVWGNRTPGEMQVWIRV
ncbi:glycoside hydrolase family 127 protein [Faecalicatena orotica]|uniref:Glycoside hydrolase family 127 protein n=1 Tax=Faecalicatena orotica TaxID=1544 RepID=A0A2Y9BHE9_9FIRM|nr:beta-L-arabinofuranosidase domain-containing protein [Faecalicatena orotica]PWJ30903.1 hypothetical protein A8806_103311 [Faecalicatena orotica]SSA55065.1 hypothetical protein SAMN05216536_103311 [Faecalicatena orotica]